MISSRYTEIDLNTRSINIDMSFGAFTVRGSSIIIGISTGQTRSSFITSGTLLITSQTFISFFIEIFLVRTEFLFVEARIVIK